MRKRIGVNALSINHRPSGGRTYLLNTLRSVIKTTDDYQFFILCSKKVKDLFEEQIVSDNLTYVTVPTMLTRSFTRFFIEQLFLPIWLWHNRIDLLFAARNVMPIFARCPTVIGVLSMHLNYELNTISKWRRKTGDLLLRMSARRAKAYLAISQFAGNTFVQKYSLNPDRLFVSPLGVDIENNRAAFSPTKSKTERVTARSEKLLFVSTLFPHKNVQFLLETFAHVARARNSTRLVIVGRDANNIRPELEQLSSEFSIRDRVDFVGIVTKEKLDELYLSSALFVFPSLVEGFGLPVLEAMACGLPVIVSNRTALPEVVGDAGIILEPENALVWAEKILLILENKLLHEELCSKSIARARLFTWDRTAQLTVECFRRVLD